MRAHVTLQRKRQVAPEDVHRVKGRTRHSCACWRLRWARAHGCSAAGDGDIRAHSVAAELLTLNVRRGSPLQPSHPYDKSRLDSASRLLSHLTGARHSQQDPAGHSHGLSGAVTTCDIVMATLFQHAL